MRVSVVNTKEGSLKLFAIVGALALLCGTGCIAHSAVVSNDRKAYVASGSIFGTSMYHCTAEGGQAICTHVSER